MLFLSSSETLVYNEKFKGLRALQERLSMSTKNKEEFSYAQIDYVLSALCKTKTSTQLLVSIKLFRVDEKIIFSLTLLSATPFIYTSESG